MTLRLFARHTVKQHASAIAAYLPGGKIFEAARIEGTNQRKFLSGFARELLRVEQLLNTYVEEYHINVTTLFIEEWERAVGIPDDCFSNSGTIEERRRNVLVKLASLGVQTKDDFVALAQIFGIETEVKSGTEVPELNIPSPEARFTIIIQFYVRPTFAFPFTFPIRFGDSTMIIMECLFNKLIPANCQVIFQSISKPPTGFFGFNGYPTAKPFGDFFNPGNGGFFKNFEE